MLFFVWNTNNFPKKYFHDFEKLARGMKSDLCFSLICGKSVRDSRRLMKPFSLPYECIFHLMCIGFSASAQFSHRNIFELFARSTLVTASWSRTSIFGPKSKIFPNLKFLNQWSIKYFLGFVTRYFFVIVLLAVSLLTY